MSDHCSSPPHKRRCIDRRGDGGSGSEHGNCALCQSVRENLHSKLQRYRLVLVEGETGSGKSTEVPKLLMQKYSGQGTGVVIVTRRLAASRACARVGRGFHNGEVGYATGGSASPLGTQLTFMTVGWFVHRYAEDTKLSGLKFIVVDEIHERDAEADLCLFMVRAAMQARPDLVVLLMSATLQVQRFLDYFLVVPELKPSVDEGEPFMVGSCCCEIDEF